MAKKIYYEGDKGLEGLRWVARVVDFGVGLTVISAFNAVYSAQSFLLDRPDLFRHAVKRHCMNAVNAASRMENEIKSNMRSESFWVDYSERVKDEAETDVTLFRVSIKQSLDNANFADSEMFSYIECARVMLEMCVTQYDCIMKQAKARYECDFRKDFLEFRPTVVLGHWKKMCAELYKDNNKGSDIDLTTADVTGMFNRMCRKFAEGTYISACLKDATAKNPDFIQNEIELKKK